ncbi:glycosyltransferase family 2 protein [Actinokineospora auranticolor]|uniref:Glycosyl transferase family 2 n=1 Tax=Actinokineospora auranticolor TaxID=155976 RepID=A0A2S6GLP8_9PSEU|nr:glycosyltransferase family 2 protein [Actinokineospora auranticolor]PPK66147.1 glycosyl transferase family 2 [Actinokineospora auranticolor]
MRTAAGASVLAAVHALINARLMRVPPDDPPVCREPVSLLLPVRDEAHRVGPAVRSVLAQRGVPDLEIIVLDDGSTDGTAEVVRDLARGDRRLRVVTGAPPPPGLPGKPHACAQLVERSRGRVLVMVDADVVLAPHAVASAVALLRAHGLDAVSPFPSQLADDVATRLVQPLLQWSWLVFLPLRLAERSPRPSLTAANGQFLVLDAAALDRAGGYRAVAGAVLDDIAVVRAIKRAGGRGAVVDGSALAVCRMYTGWDEVRQGYEKSLWSATGSLPAAAALAAGLAWLFVLPPLAALTGSGAGALGYFAGVAGRVVSARATGGRAWPDSLAHPVSVGALLVLVARSWRARRAGALTWKGRDLAGGT